MLPERLRGTEIIDPPADVLFSSIEHVAPPGVMAGVFGEQPERVQEARIENPAKALPLFVCEAGVLPVGFRMRQVTLLVCHIQITAENYRLFLLQLFNIQQEITIPLLAVIQAC